MKRSTLFGACLVLALLLMTSIVVADINIPDGIMLTPESRARLSRWITADSRAKILWAEVEARAKNHLTATPNPTAVIYYEGLLDTDSRRIATIKHLEDMIKVTELAWAFSGDSAGPYGPKLRQFILAWARTYIPTGNPINENKLEPIIHAHYLVRSGFTSTERTTVESWLKTMGEKEKSGAFNGSNWDTKRFKLVGQIGMVLGNQSFIDYSFNVFKDYVAKSLYPDGTTYDFIERDALAYHVSGLKPILAFAIVAAQANATINGQNLCEYQSSTGSSLRKSVEFVDPYARGELTHAEWVNTKAQIDKDRAAAGIPEYQPGILWDPQQSIPLYELATAFNPSYAEMVAMLTQAPADSPAPTWLTLMCIAAAGVEPLVETSVQPGGRVPFFVRGKSPLSERGVKPTNPLGRAIHPRAAGITLHPDAPYVRTIHGSGQERAR